MEDQAATLLALLKKSSASVDVKLNQFNNLKAKIKHERVPDEAQPAIFECIRLAIASQTSPALVQTGFSALAHLIRRLNLQDQNHVTQSHSGRLLPILAERLGDQREKSRDAASQLLMELWSVCDRDVERIIRDHSLIGTNPRAKESAMLWIVRMHQDKGLQFRGFVPNLVANLEDADGAVRDVAKHAVVELFRNAPDRAKADLKKQLTKYSVRSSIASHIISQLGISTFGSTEPDLKSSTISVAPAPASHLQPDTGFAESVLGEAPPPTDIVVMEPLYVHSQRELEEIFREMQPHFEGRETEQNWLLRDKSVTKLRRLTRGNAPVDYQAVFLADIKNMLDGVLKVANSLRTTMSTNGCQFIQELARTVGPGMDPMCEILLQNFIKMSGATKSIASQNGNQTVDTIFGHVSYSQRLMQHVWFACQDKNVQPRVYATTWLKTLIRKHASHKSQLEHSGGLDLIEKCVKRGIEDPNPKVKEGSRSTFWAFASLWPQRAEIILNGLDDKTRQRVESDPSNPNVSLATSQVSHASSLSKSRGPGGSSRSLKETIALQKKQLAARRLPDRPNSAQSSFSSPQKPSTATASARGPSGLSTSQTARPGGTTTSTVKTTGTGSLMSGPIRRPRREAPRPATADPYAARQRALKPATPADSPPRQTPNRETTTRKPVASKGPGRPKTPAPSSPSYSPSKTKSRVDQMSHKKNASSGSAVSRASPAASPSKAEDLTMVLPPSKLNEEAPANVMSFSQWTAGSVARQNDAPTVEEDEGFTMVIPNIDLPKGPTPVKSPPKQYASPHQVNGYNRQAAPMTPRARAVDRLQKDEHDFPSGEGVQVYEDPVADEDARTTEQPDKPVLEELPLSKNNADRSSFEGEDASHTVIEGNSSAELPRKVSTPDPESQQQQQQQAVPDRGEVLKSRRLLTSGIDRIREKTLDVHGFRRLQDIVKSPVAENWGDTPEGQRQRFAELLVGLLVFLETPVEALTAGPGVKAVGLKTQALGTLRVMLTTRRPGAEAEVKHALPRALASVLRARRGCEGAPHLALELERMTEEVVRSGIAAGQGGACLESVLGLVDEGFAGRLEGAAANPTLTAGLAALARLVESGKVVLPEGDGVEGRLAAVAVRALADTDPDVRKGGLEFCLRLHERVGERAFWEMVGGEGGLSEGGKSLVTYYLARRARVQG